MNFPLLRRASRLLPLGNDEYIPMPGDKASPQARPIEAFDHEVLQQALALLGAGYRPMTTECWVRGNTDEPPGYVPPDVWAALRASLRPRRV